MKSLIVIKRVIEQYDFEGKDMQVSQVQDLRDDLSTSLYLLADHYADCKMKMEAAEYARKKRVAVIQGDLYGETVDGKKITQKGAELHAIINAEKWYEDERIATRDYEHIRQIFHTANNTMNSMASRINILLRNE